MASFNLIDRPWIPCIRLDGARDELSLRDTLTQAQAIREIQGDSPLETAAILRLLLAVLHRVFRPSSWMEWRLLWQKAAFDAPQVEAYVGRPEIYVRFDLFHPVQPFYQFRDSRAGEKSVISLVLDMASGNNATLFDHHTESAGATLTPAQAARALITAQAFGIGGLSGMSEPFTDAPCAKGVLFFAAGTTLFETLVLSLVRYSDDKPLPVSPEGDALAWEMEDPFRPERRKPRGYLDYLTWHNRRIWLIPEESERGTVVRRMSWAPGLRLDAADTDPMKQYLPDQAEGWDILNFRPDRALWRDSAVLLKLGDNDRPPGVVRWMSELARMGMLDTRREYYLLALGMAKSRASLAFLRAESLPLPASFLTDDDQVGCLSAALELAEKAGRRLSMATFNLARLLLNPRTNDQETTDEKTLEKLRKTYDQSKDDEAKRVGKLARSWGVEPDYWSQLGVHFHGLVNDLPRDPEGAAAAWRGQLRRAARNAFQRAQDAVSDDARAARALAIATNQFEAAIYRLLETSQPAQQTDGGNNP
jgi:CRISPR system Cascade subunit CasA